MANQSLLLVEGKSETAVIKELCKTYSIPITFDIMGTNGNSELKIALKTELKSTNKYKKLWVIIDADDNFASVWQSIKDILSRSGRYDIPAHLALPKEGIIIQPKETGNITIGVWIMPNNTDIGMLEDFLISLIEPNDVLLKKAIKTIEELELDRANIPELYKKVHQSKATIYTWLAWRRDPGESLNTAIQKQFFKKDAELRLLFCQWLNELN